MLIVIFQAANWRVVKGKMNFVLALAMSFSELFTKFAMPIFSERPYCQTTIANFVTNVEKIKRIEIENELNWNWNHFGIFCHHQISCSQKLIEATFNSMVGGSAQWCIFLANYKMKSCFRSNFNEISITLPKKWVIEQKLRKFTICDYWSRIYVQLSVFG
jgi:hypothetical protein